MRMLMKVSIPVDAGNALVRSGKLGDVIGQILADLKPEAAYFAEVDGLRTGIIVVNLDHAHEIPKIAEPFFLALNARVEFHPAMTPEDLKKAGPDLQAASKKY